MQRMCNYSLLRITYSGIVNLSIIPGRCKYLNGFGGCGEYVTAILELLVISSPHKDLHAMCLESGCWLYIDNYAKSTFPWISASIRNQYTKSRINSLLFTLSTFMLMLSLPPLYFKIPLRQSPPVFSRIFPKLCIN